MSIQDGLVLQLHPGVLRDHHREVRSLYGADRGFDIPVPVDFVRGLRPLLNAFGRDPAFRMVAFTVDETSYARELAPLAGVYPALKPRLPHPPRRLRPPLTPPASVDLGLVLVVRSPVTCTSPRSRARSG